MRETADQRDQRNPGHQPANLRRRFTCRQTLLQLRDQICQRHVDEAATGHDQKIRQEFLQLIHQPVTCQPPQGCHCTGQRNLEDRCTFIARARAQHHQITHMVWHLMRQHSERRNQTQMQIRHKR